MIRFVLNQEEIATNAPAGLLLLDWIRKHRRLTGTKEGCKEGDCGACMVILGRLVSPVNGNPNGPPGDAPVIRYQPVTSCLVPLGECYGTHVVTIEGLNLPDGLSPVQAAVFETGASQCGYCTPGFVVSLTAWLMDPDLPPSLQAAKYAMSGNLCRCTGYRSLKNAAVDLSLRFADLSRRRIADLVARGALPDWFTDAPDRLAAISPPSNPRKPGCHPLATENSNLPPIGNSPASPQTAPREPAPASVVFTIAGGTDLYVQRGEEIPDESVRLLADWPGLTGFEQTADGWIWLGARTTFEDFGRNPILQGLLPGLGRWMTLMASWQIRNRATLAGNIVNASPIADMTSLLQALGANVRLVDPASGVRRTVALRNFFLDYKVTAKAPHELIESIGFPSPTGAFVNWEKVSKREYLDIATVNAGARLRVDAATNRIADAELCLGGVAAIPLVLKEAGSWLVGQEVSTETVAELLDRVQAEISPISDVRGSADYKRLLARQLTLAHFVRGWPKSFQPGAWRAFG